MKFKLFVFILAAFTIQADTLSVHCPIGCPSNPANNDLVFAHVYALSNNPTTKFADWVAYEVDVRNFGDSPGRKWRSDPLLAHDKTLEKDDYKGANSSALQADRGHQAPLASFAGSRYWSELNLLSNITPQKKELNQGAWKSLEAAVRATVSYRNTLFVITGPIYEGKPKHLPNADEPNQVPSGYFKIVYDLSGGATAFLMKQTAGRQDTHCSKITTLGTIQSKLNFKLPSLRQSILVKLRLGC